MGLTRTLGRLFRHVPWAAWHQRLPVRPVARLREGAVAKIQGRALCLGEPLLAPLSGRACLLFRVTVERYDLAIGMRTGGVGPGGSAWLHETEEELAPPFLLEDETGVAVVRPEGWMDLIAPARQFAGSGLRAAEIHMDAFRARYGSDRATFLLGSHGRVRYRETVVCEGETVFVAGTVGVERPGADAAYPRGATPRMVMHAPGDDRLVVGTRRSGIFT